MTQFKVQNMEPPPLAIRKPESYRPPGSLPHKVSDGEHWGSLAARYKVDARTLIDQNFGTHEPKYVNWYLWHHLKCDKATADGYNLRFSTLAGKKPGLRAGTVFITPNWFALQSAARFLATKWLRQFIASASLGPYAVFLVDSVSVTGANIGHSGAAFGASFTQSLQWQGATSELAEAWQVALLESMVHWLRSTDTLIPMTPPGLGDRDGANKPSHFVAKDWKLLKDAVQEPSAEHFALGMLPALDWDDNAVARRELRAFGAWWRRTLVEAAAAIEVAQISCHGSIDGQAGRWSGTVLAPRGFLRWR